MIFIVLISYLIIFFQVSGGIERSHAHSNGGESASLNSVGVSSEIVKEACTPNLSALQKRGMASTSKKQETAKKIASLVKNNNTSGLRTKAHLQSSAMRTKLPPSAVKAKDQSVSSAMKSVSRTTNFSQENQAIKRQKLDGGKARQVNVIVCSFILFF